MRLEHEPASKPLHIFVKQSGVWRFVVMAGGEFRGLVFVVEGWEFRIGRRFWCLVFGVWCLVSCVWCSVFGLRVQRWVQGRSFGAWDFSVCLVLGAWCFVLGVWCLGACIKAWGWV